MSITKARANASIAMRSRTVDSRGDQSGAFQQHGARRCVAQTNAQRTAATLELPAPPRHVNLKPAYLQTVRAGLRAAASQPGGRSDDVFANFLSRCTARRAPRSTTAKPTTPEELEPLAPIGRSGNTVALRLAAVDPPVHCS